MDFEFILISIIIPGLVGGALAPIVSRKVTELFSKWRKKRKLERNSS